MKKIIFRLLVIVLIVSILSCGAYFAYKYYLDNKNKEVEKTFYSCILKNNFKNIFDFELEENILDKLDKSDYVSKTKVNFSNTAEVGSKFDVDKFTVEVNTKRKSDDKKLNVKFDYSNNELFNFDLLLNRNYVAVKNSDIVNNYIGLKKDKISNILAKTDSDINELYKKIDNLKNANSITENENINFELEDELYIDLFKKYLKSPKFANEGSKIIEQNGKKMDVEAYSLTIDKEDFLRIYGVISEQIVNDESIKSAIISTSEFSKNEENIESRLTPLDVVLEKKDEIYSMKETGSNAITSEKNYPEDVIQETELLKKIDYLVAQTDKNIEDISNYQLLYNAIKYIFVANTNFGLEIDENDLTCDLEDIFNIGNEYIENNLDEKDDVKFITYVSNDENVRTCILLGDDIEINIDYISDNSKNICLITFSKQNENSYNGYIIKFEKNKTTAIDNNYLEIGKIEDTKIVSKIELKLKIEGTLNSNKYNNEVSVVYNGVRGKSACNIGNTISFENCDVENITSDNTVILDALDDRTFNKFMNKLNSQIENIYEEKLSKLHLIDANLSDTIIQRTENDVANADLENERAEKEKIIDLLVEKVSNEMGEAELAGKEYTIQNLKNLELEGYELQVSLSNNIAIIKINNYTFKIDKDFNLSE